MLRKTAVFLTFLAVAQVAGAAQEPEPWFEEQCARALPPNRVMVTSAPSAMAYDFTKSITDLSVAKQGMTVIGLTKARFSAEATTERRQLSIPGSDVACARLEVTVTATASPQTVYVAKELPKGTCTHNYVLNHEFHHVHANQGHLETTVDQLNKDLADLLGTNIIYGTPLEIERQVQDYVSTQLLPYIQGRVTENEQLHKDIDDADSFEQTNAACKGELSQLWPEFSKFQ